MIFNASVSTKKHIHKRKPKHFAKELEHTVYGLTDHFREGPEPWRWRKSPCKQNIVRTMFNIFSVLLTFI